MTKRDADFQKGKFNREKIVSYVNLFLENEGVKLSRVQECLKIMEAHEKSKNATLNNMLIPSSFMKAMGLDYIITSKNRPSFGPRVAFLIKSKGGGIFRKVPKEYKLDKEGYLKVLQSFNYYFIIVDLEKMTFSLPISINIAIKYWKYEMQISKGNTNRLQFYGAVSSIDLLPANFPTFSGSLVDNLILLSK
jgi:hypothetical protein